MELDLTQYLQYAAALLFVLALIGLLVWVLKRISGGRNSAGGKRGRRLAVSEAAVVDKRRRLVLIRRDGVEHLVMIGGPQDVVIETGITPPAAAIGDADIPEAAEPARRATPELPRERPAARDTDLRPPPPPPLEPRPRPAPPERPASPAPPERPAPTAVADRLTRPLTSTREQDRDPASPFSDRPAPDRLKPDKVDTDQQTVASRRSMLNVRPGEEK